MRPASFPLLALATVLAVAAVVGAQEAPDPPGPPEPPVESLASEAPVEVEVVDEDEGSCAETDGGATCHSHRHRGLRVGVAGAAEVALVSERHRVAGHHDGPDGSTPNHWEDTETTRGARADLATGPAPATAEAHVTDASRSHRQGGGPEPGQGTDSQRVAAGAVLAVGGPADVAVSPGTGATATESFADDGHHRCRAQVDDLPALEAPCPTSIPGDSGLPPSGTLP